MIAQQRKFIAAVSLCTAFIVPNIVSAAAISGQGTWVTTLQGRDLDGNLNTAEAYYDMVLGITWLADANSGAGSSYDDIGTFYESTTDGRMSWINANAWAASLNPYGSDITGWRLPTTTDTGAPGAQCTYSGTDCGFNVNTASSEMANMFYVTLGDKAYYTTTGSGSQAGWGLTNTGPFSNIQPNAYWSITEYALSTSIAWDFNFGSGDQYNDDKTNMYSAWAVHAGDVGVAIPSAVPVPAAAWLFGSGLLGLIGISRQKSSQQTTTTADTAEWWLR